MGILQNTVNPSLDPTRPDPRGRNCPLLAVGVKVSPVCSNSTVFLRMDIISEYGEEINQSKRLVYAPLAWTTTDSGNGLVSSLCQAIAWTNFDSWLTAQIVLTEQIPVIFYYFVKKYLEMICKLLSSCLGLNVLKASFPHTCYYHDNSNPLHIRKQHVFPDLSIDLVA